MTRPSGRVLGWIAAICVPAAIGMMIFLTAASPQEIELSQRTLAALARPPAGPPWWPTKLRIPWIAFVSLSWAATVLGVIGVLAGVAAITRGARPRRWPLLAGAVIAAAILAVLPRAGSSDPQNYAAYGRMVILGVNPYLVTPVQLTHASHDPVARAVNSWKEATSVYGPLGTAEEAGAALLGGTVAARIIFWLKIWNALAFLAVALALDRLLRGDPARRLRAHLIWSVNPLLLWAVVAAGHIDGLAAAVGFLGVVVLRQKPGDGPARQLLWRAFAAGLLTGAAADIKVNFALFILGVAWAVRRSRAALLAVFAGAAAVLVPSYAAFGWPAVTAAISRGGGNTWDNLYRLFYAPFGVQWPDQPGTMVISTIVFVALAAAALRWLPDGVPELPAVRPALAISLAWLLAGAFQRPWYDVMALCLLALYPGSALDSIVMIRLAACTAALMPAIFANDGNLMSLPVRFFTDYGAIYTPAIRLAALVTLVVLLLVPSWRRRFLARGPAPGLRPDPPVNAVTGPRLRHTDLLGK